MIKSIRNLAIGILTAFVLLAGCSSSPKASSTGKAPVMLDHAGRALGNTNYPPWVVQWATHRNINNIEAMREYRDDYVFVAEETGTNLNAVQAWANTVVITDTIGSRISTRVGSTAEANVTAENNASYSNWLNNVMTVTRDATFTGAVRTSDYWIKWRIYDPDDETKSNDEYTVYVLYTIRKNILNEQIANQFRVIQNNANTEAERAMWTGLIQAVLERGLGVEIDQQSPKAEFSATFY